MPLLLARFRRNPAPAAARLPLVDYLDLWPTDHIVLERGSTRVIMRAKRDIRVLLKGLNRPITLLPATEMMEPLRVDFHFEHRNRLGGMHFELLVDRARSVISRPDFGLEASVDAGVMHLLLRDWADADG
ncbi:MAG: hypothetical protein HYX50_02955 [Chloroflexi bacterium]|nr:hypothetical protein [Chloroflexota bacterium]